MRHASAAFLIAVTSFAACTRTAPSHPAAVQEVPPTAHAPGLAESGQRCGTIAYRRCEPTAFCDYADEFVVADDAAGICRDRPTECPSPSPTTAKVCGNNGRRYESACFANLDGADVIPAGFAGCPQS